MFKEKILSQVSIILQSVESIVSQMSTYSESENCQCQENFWWDDQQEAVNNFEFDRVSEISFSTKSETEVSVSDFLTAPRVPAYTEMTSPYMKSALVAAISHELEDTAMPLNVSPMPVPGPLTTEEEVDDLE